MKITQTLTDRRHPIIVQVLKESEKAIVSLSIRCSSVDWNSNTNLPKNIR